MKLLDWARHEDDRLELGLRAAMCVNLVPGSGVIPGVPLLFLLHELIFRRRHE